MFEAVAKHKYLFKKIHSAERTLKARTSCKAKMSLCVLWSFTINCLSVRGVQGTTCTRKCIVFFWFIFAGGSLVYTDIGKQCTKSVRNRSCQQQAQTSCISNTKTSLNKSYDYFCQYFPIIYLLGKKHCDDKANFRETMHDTIIAGRLRSSITISKNQFSSLTAIRFSCYKRVTRFETTSDIQ